MNLQRLNVQTGQPLMIPEAANIFNELRETVKAGCGFDFLGKCADIFRDAGLQTTKSGVAFKSFHKTGRAFDYDQTEKRLVIVSEPANGKQYWRTYLKCANQDGTQGKKLIVHDWRGYNVSSYLFYFTAAAEGVQFKRIPARAGWQQTYNCREFWHYQYNPQNLTWEQAMMQIK